VILILLGTTLAATGQNIRLEKSPDLQLATSISEEELSQIITTLEATLNEYGEVATLYDKDQKRVTEESINKFYELFSPTAEVMKDYAEYIPEELVPFKDYSLEVYNMFKTKGIQVRIERAVLTEIKVDLSGFYTPTVIVTKKIFNTLSANGTTNSIATGKTIAQKMIFDIYKDELGEAKIGKIDFEAPPVTPDDYTRILSIPVRLGTSSYSSTTSDYWNSTQSQANLDVSGGLNFSVGFELLTDRLITSKKTSDRKLALTIGAQFSSYSMKTTLDGFGFEMIDTMAIHQIDSTEQRYIRQVSSVNVEEKLNFSTLQLPVGLALRLANKRKMSIYTHFRFIPSFTFGANGNLQGAGTYDAFRLFGGNVPSQDRICRPNSVNPDLLELVEGYGDFELDRAGTPTEYSICGRQTIEASTEPELNRLTYLLQISPTAYIKFGDDNPGWGLIIGLDASYRLGSLIEHSPINALSESPFRYSDVDSEGSLLSQYTDNVSALNFGLRIGLFQKLTNEP